MKKHNLNWWLALISISFCYAACYTASGIRGILYDATQEAMGVTNTQLALLTTISATTGMCTRWIGGPIADKISPKKLIIISMVARGPLCFLSAAFPQVRWLQCCVWCGFSLTGGLVFWPAILKAVRVVGGNDQNNTYGLFEGSQGGITMIINAVAIAVFGLFSNNTAGYRGAMTTMGVFCILSAIMLAYCYKENLVTDDSITEPATGEKRGASMKDIIALIKMPDLWLCAIAMFGTYGLYTTQSYFTPYFTNVLGTTIAFSGFLAIFRDAGMKLIAGPLGGVVATKLRSTSKLQIICLVLCMAMIAYISTLSAGGTAVWVAMAIVLLMGFFLMQAKGTMWAIMDEARIPVELSGTAIMLCSYISQSIPDAVLPLFNGMILDHYADDVATGYRMVFVLLLVIAACGVFASAAIYFRNRNKKKVQTQ